MIPQMERILVGYLTGNLAIAAIVGDRVATKTPSNLKEPWVRVVQIDAPPAGRSSADHLIAFYCQLDCYAGKKGTRVEAEELHRLVRSAIAEIGDHTFEGAVISGAKINGSRPLPDTDLDEQIDRYIVTATIWAHS